MPTREDPKVDAALLGAPGIDHDTAELGRVFGQVDDLDGLRAFAQELRELGYYGMMLGNPVHVPLVHEIFTPTPDEVSYWKELVALADGAEAAGSDERVLHGDANQGEGHVIHLAHVESARLNLEWARDLGVA